MLVKKNKKKKQKALLSQKKMCDKSLFGEMKTWADTESNGEKADAYFTEE